MKRFALIFGILMFCVAVFAHTINNSNFIDTSNTNSSAFSNTTRAGDLLVACAGTDPSGTAGDFTGSPITLSDSTTMTSAGGMSIATGDGFAHQYCAFNGNLGGGATPTIKGNTTGSAVGPSVAYAGLYYLEWEGPFALDVASSNAVQNSAPSPLTSNTITTHYNNELIVCIGSGLHYTGYGFSSAGTGYTGVAFGSQGIEYKIAATPGSQSCTMNLNGTAADYTLTIMAFYSNSPRLQGVSCEASGLSSACAMPNNVTGGNTILWAATEFSGTGSGALTPSTCGGTNHTVDASGTTSAPIVAHGYITGITAGACTVTFTWAGSSGGFVTGTAEEVTPVVLDPSAHSIKNPTQSVTGGTTFTTTSVTSTASDYCFSYAVDAGAGGGTPLVSGPFMPQDTNSVFGESDADTVQTAPAAITATWKIIATTTHGANTMACYINGKTMPVGVH